MGITCVPDIRMWLYKEKQRLVREASVDSALSIHQESPRSLLEKLANEQLYFCGISIVSQCTEGSIRPRRNIVLVGIINHAHQYLRRLCLACQCFNVLLCSKSDCDTKNWNFVVVWQVCREYWLTKDVYLVPNRWRKYPKHGGQEHVHDANDGPQPQQQSFIFQTN